MFRGKLGMVAQAHLGTWYLFALSTMFLMQKGTRYLNGNGRYLGRHLIAVLLSLFLASSALAAGLTVPAGSTVNVNTGTLNVAGDLAIQGTLQTSTGTVSTSGNWTNTGTYTPGTGTASFTKSSGTQTLNSGGTAVGKLFNNFSHTGAGTLQLTTNTVNIDGNFSNTAGALDENGQTIDIAGNWANSGTATIYATTGTVNFNGTNQAITGSTTFYNFTKSTATTDTLTFPSAGTQSIAGTLTMNGNDALNLLSINSDDDDATPTQFAINLLPAGLQAMSYLNVKNSNAGGGLTLIAGTGSTNAGNNTNWVFGGTTFTWQGDVSTAWTSAGNWDLGAVPGSADIVIIPDVTGSGGVQPILSGAVTVTTMTLQTSATVTLLQNNLTVSGVLTNNGTIILAGNQTLSFGTMDVAQGTFKFVGDSDGISETFTLPEFGATDFFNLTIDDSTATPDSFVVTAGQSLKTAGTLNVTRSTLNISTNTNTLTTTGTLTVNGGTLTATNGNIDANGAVTISSGTLTAPTTGKSFTIAGNFTQSGGTFTNSSGTVTLDGTAQTLSASATTFYNLTKAVTSADTLTFSTTVTQANAPIITHALILTGTSGNILSINSSSAATEAYVKLQAGGVQTLQYLNVRDSNAAGGLTLVARNSSQPNGNNTNWAFGGATITWDGSSSTDWDTADNWDLGVVPNDEDTAVIASVANDPTLATNTRVENLTINTGATVSLNAKNLTIDSTLSNNGTVRAMGSETISITTTDTDSGTFVFVGNGDGTVDTRTLPDFGSGTDYFNLTINDVNATKDIFRTNANLTIAGALNISSSQLDISTNTNTLTTTGTLTVNGGTLTATNGNIDANGSVVISSGTLTAPTTGKSFTVAGSWTHSGGTFTANTGTVTFDSAATATFTGDTTFYNLTSSTGGKTLLFVTGTNQTVSNTLTLNGTVGNLITLNVSTLASADQWSITPASAQYVQYLNVNNSDALTNTITCTNCTDGGTNNANWIFQILAIDVPLDVRTTDTTPTIIGRATAGATVTIKDSSNATIATTTADASGNFRIELSTAMAVGANTLTAYVGVSFGNTINITIVSAPTTDQQPTITSHANGDRINGSKPTIKGKGLANTAVTIKAKDLNGSLLLTSVGTGTTDANGNYSITLTTALPKGTNYLTTTVDGVATNIVSVSLTDPFGIVFDSVTNQAIANATVTIYRSSDNQRAVVGTDLASTDVNPVTTGADGFYSFLTANNNYYITVSADLYSYPSTLSTFPSNRTIVTGSKGETFTVSGVIIEMDHPMDASGQILRLTKDANKKEVRIGEIVTYTVTIENLSAHPVTEVRIEDLIPAGFKYLSNRVTMDGVPIADPSGGRPLQFAIGTVPPNGTMILKYQLVVGSGVTPGKYDNTAFARYVTGNRLSNNASETVKVVLDPLFDLGTVLGKVFFDKNENGLQDAPEFVQMDQETITEDPIPNVRIVMEDGTVVVTDPNGQFHIPSIAPGRHLFRVDEATLPRGYHLTTEKVVIVDITPGILSKVNFGVSLNDGIVPSDDQSFFASRIKVTQNKEKLKPRLNASIFGGAIVSYNNLFAEKAEFRIFTNYDPFIDSWKLEIVDQDTNKTIQSFEGNRFNIHDPVYWDGRDNKGEFIRLDRNYAYRVYVESKDQKFDETNSHALPIKILQTEKEYQAFLDSRKDNRKDYLAWLSEENKKDDHKTQTILLDGESIVIDPLASKISSIKIKNKQGELLTELPIVEQAGLTARELLESNISQPDQAQAPIEVILPKGDYELVVQENPDNVSQLLSPERRDADTILAIKQDVGSSVRSHSQTLKVGDDYFFFVGMGDAKAGYTFHQGSVEPVSPDDKYSQGFWTEGKMAYYLKGKILGKYIITSSFDSDRKKKELFKDIKSDEYYPIYGDKSTLDYQAADTQGNLYLLLEWDKSSAIWGNYTIGFSDTEFAKFSRTLYGGKVDYQSLSSTKFGDPRSKMVVFRAQANQKSAHNEFLATGGSLYYLKHRGIIEGSDKVTIEVRDKTTGVVVSSREMKEGADYQIDDGSGRIIFWKPVSLIVTSYSIISDELLSGNLAYVVVDYEYDVKDKYNEDNIGLRVQQAVTDHVSVGTTYVKESLETNDYELKGADVKVHLGDNAVVKAEIAQSASQAQGSFVSTDGGLTFSELSTSENAEGKAYGMSGDARLFNRLGLTSYYKWIDSDFSSSATTAQQGKELIGLGAVYDISDKTRFTAKHDIQSLLNSGNLQTQAQVGAQKTATTLLQIVHELRRLNLTAEYRRQEVTNKLDQFESKTNVAENIIAVNVDYTVNDKLTVSAGEQVSLNGKKDYATTVGATYKPQEKLTIAASETLSKEGTATRVGVNANVTNNVSLNAEQAMTSAVGGLVSKTSTVGAQAKVTDDASVTTSFGSTELSSGGKTSTMTLGGSSKINDKTTSESQISMSDSSVDGKTTSYSFGTVSKLSEQLQLASTKTFGTSREGLSESEQYGLARINGGRKLEGSLAHATLHGPGSVSESNIYGLSGDINDNFALTGSMEKGRIQNLDGTQTDRLALALGAGYVIKDLETGVQRLTGSTKIENRFDQSDADKRQFLITSTIEGKVTDNATLFSKLEFSKTRDITNGITDASYHEMMFGGAYRPINFDRLNLIGRYTYQEEKAPKGQADLAGVEQQKGHILATEAVYDLTEHWQISEKIAYRIGEEKVQGFDFSKTHTWLLIHRLNYKIDSYWTIGGEFRTLTQKEAQDVKRGFLVEGSRRVGDFAQLGVGFNFTDFSDELTDLSYRSFGPFVRLTGKLYDRTPDEIERAKQKWLEEKITSWAWIMVNEEVNKASSPVMDELNEYFVLAQNARRNGDMAQAQKIYKDIIMAGEMMAEEAKDHIRGHIKKEEGLQKRMKDAEQFMKEGQYEKAKKIFEKIMEDVQGVVLK